MSHVCTTEEQSGQETTIGWEETHVHERCCNDHSCAELLDDHQTNCVDARERHFGQEQGCKHADTAGHQNHKQSPNSEAYVVVSLCQAARKLRLTAALATALRDTVPAEC